jgi:predicted nucleic acid-binding protein
VHFVDTNILLYSISGEPKDEQKSAIAASILQSADLALSIQVLQEFYVQATRTTRANRLPHDEALGFIDTWLRFPIQEMTVEIFQAALATCQRYRISYWDAAIVEAARAIGCKQVLSEDLNDGQNFGGVRVVNPFAVKRNGRTR